jgi:hypothetical protein
MRDDPDLTAAAAELGGTLRRLFPSPADVEAALRDGLIRAQSAGGPAGELAAGLIEVMNLAHRWNLQSGDDPGATIRPGDAAGEIINAIARGLGS